MGEILAGPTRANADAPLIAIPTTDPDEVPPDWKVQLVPSHWPPRCGEAGRRSICKASKPPSR